MALECICSGVTLVSQLKMNAALFDYPTEKEPCQRGPTAKQGIKLIIFKQMLTKEGWPWKEMKVIG
ncbi:MAG: hypothetical protein NTZ52_07840 [Chlamydiae bacterium]|nr:hypothetical protein [Chlamydiota bacterium]